MGEEQKKLLEQQLWNIANTLRGKMDADEFRDYILGFIFYKYLSEKIEHYADHLLKEDELLFSSLDENGDEGKEYLDAIKEDAIESLGYFLKPSELFSAVAKRGNGDTDNFILEDLTSILRSIEQSTMGHASEDDFEHLFEDLDLTSTKLGRTEEAKNTLIAKVLSHLDNIDFELKNHDRDVLGDAYEYLISQFASGAGKKAGEFYTPQQVSKILAKLVTNKKTKLKSVYDPTCGSGSLLLRVAKEVEDVSNFYGQELNRTTYNLSRMNMIMHDVHYRKFDIKQEDTLENPQHREERFEAIVANPPFSAHWSANQLHMSDDRFSQYGKLAPKTKADFAFIQHMIYQLDDNGTMAVVMPHGVLFRGSAEGHIRKYLIEDKNYLDAVIGLPANIFYGTSIPTAILVFKKCREDSDNILFIDASAHFKKIKAQNFLTDENVKKIVDTYKDRKTEDKYSHLASLDEIKENNYNLNIPRYVDTFEKEELIDLDEVNEYINEIENLSKNNDEILFKYCDELNIPKPKGNNVGLLKLYKKGVMQKIFSHEIRFKDDNGETTKLRTGSLKDFGYFYYGKSAPKHSLSETAETPCVRYGELYNKYNEYIKEIHSYTEIDRKNLKFSKGGEVLVPRVGEDPLAFANCSYLPIQDVAIGEMISVYNTEENGLYLTYYINTMLRHKFARVVEGGNVSNLYFKYLEDIQITIPPIDEQTKIANFLSSINSKIEQAQKQFDSTKNFKKALLKQMFV